MFLREVGVNGLNESENADVNWEQKEKIPYSFSLFFFFFICLQTISASYLSDTKIESLTVTKRR